MPRQGIVGSTGVGVDTLVQVAHVAGGNGESLIDVCADNLAVGDAGGPAAGGELDVCLAEERVLLGGGQGGPRPRQRRRGPAAEVAQPARRVARANALDKKQVLVVGHAVHVGRLKQVVLGVLQRNHRLVHALGELRNGRRAAVQPAHVVGREEMAVGRVADDPHVDPVAAARKPILDRRRRAVGVEDLGS